MSKRHHFDHESGPNKNVRFCPRQTEPVFAGKDKEQNARLTRCNSLTLREIISDGKLEYEYMKIIRKLIFFFGDSTNGKNDDLFDGNHKWLRQIGNWRFFLPNMEHILLSYLQSMSIRRQMDRDWPGYSKA